MKSVNVMFKRMMAICLVTALAIGLLPVFAVRASAAETYTITMKTEAGTSETQTVSSSDTSIYLGSMGINVYRVSDEGSIFTKWDFVASGKKINTYSVKIGNTTYNVPADSYCSTNYENNYTVQETGIKYSYKIDGDVEISVAESEEIGDVSLTVVNYTGASSTLSIPATASIYLDATNIWGYDISGDGTSSQISERLTPSGKVALSYDINGVERYAMTDDSRIYAYNYPNGLTIRPKTIVDGCEMTLSNIKVTDEYKGYSLSFELPRDDVEMQVVGSSDADGNQFIYFKYYYLNTLVRTTHFPVAVSEYPVSLLVGTTTYKMDKMIPVSGEAMEVKFVYAGEGSTTSVSAGGATIATIPSTTTTVTATPVAATNATADMSDNSSIDSAKVKTSENGTAKISNIKSDAEEVEIDDTIEVDGVSYKVKTIGKGALKNCENVKTLTIPASVSKIEKGAFTGAKNLKTIRLNVKKSITVQKGAFKGVNTKKMTIKVSKKMSDKQYAKFQKTLKKAGYDGKVARSLK